MVEEKSFTLKHKCLGYISKKRVNRLTKENILSLLNFVDLGAYVDFIRGKFIKTSEKYANRCSELLEIVHTDISEPMTPIIYGNKYFIIFIDDF